jgi:hypothetical protein
MRRAKAALCSAVLMLSIAVPSAEAGHNETTTYGQPLTAAAAAHAAKHAHLLNRSVHLPLSRRSCAEKILIGAGIGTGAGVVIGAIVSKGDKGAIVLGAFIFSLLGTGFGYKACGP